jgi:hypothetical protein
MASASPVLAGAGTPAGRGAGVMVLTGVFTSVRGVLRPDDGLAYLNTGRNEDGYALTGRVFSGS